MIARAKYLYQQQRKIDKTKIQEDINEDRIIISHVLIDLIGPVDEFDDGRALLRALTRKYNELAKEYCRPNPKA